MYLHRMRSSLHAKHVFIVSVGTYPTNWLTLMSKQNLWKSMIEIFRYFYNTGNRILRGHSSLLKNEVSTRCCANHESLYIIPIHRLLDSTRYRVTPPDADAGMVLKGSRPLSIKLDKLILLYWEKKVEKREIGLAISVN